MLAEFPPVPFAAVAEASGILAQPLALFIAQAVVIIGVSRLIGWGARYAKQPMVIAEILAGIILGPSLFGLIARKFQELGLFQADLQQTLFPESSHATLGLVSQVGLVFFMFLVGLELDPKLMKSRGRSSLTIGLFSTVVPFGLSYLLALYLYDKVADPAKVDFLQFALFLGIGMSITAFPVLARILAERQMINSELGILTIASAAIADVVGWCLLAFIVALVHARGWSSAIWTTVLALGYISFLLLVMRPFVGRLAATAASRSGLTQNIVAFAFVLILLSSFATEWIGIHALFGAFLFGVIIPRENGYVRALVDKLEDFVVVFMLPLFFAFSGLRTEIGVLKAEHWLLCGLIVAVACLGKFGSSLIAGRSVGLKWREASVLGILMNTRGLMELVILNIGYEYGIISTELFTMMVIMALFTTFMTTPLLTLFYPRLKAIDHLGAKPVVGEALPMKPPFSMLICVAQERSGPGMATLAAALRGPDPAGAGFYALRLIRPPERSSAFVGGVSEEGGDGNAPIPLLHRADELGLDIKTISFVSVEPADDICQVAAAKQVDVVLLGWHRPIFSQSALGGVVFDVMQECKSDVAVLVDRGLTQVKRVLFAFNNMRQDRSALRLIRRLQELNGAEVTILHVISPVIGGSDQRARARDELAAGFENNGGQGGHVSVKLVESKNPPEAALEEARQGYDLIVLGLDAEWGLEQRRFGFHPEQIIQDTPVSLLIVQQGRMSTPAEPAPASPAAPAPDAPAPAATESTP